MSELGLSKKFLNRELAKRNAKINANNRYARNRSFLDTLVYTAIKDNLLPPSFKKVVGQNMYPHKWTEAYEEGLENGFVFAKYGQEDTDFYKRWKETGIFLRKNHVSILKSNTSYQNFSYIAAMGLNIVRQGAPSVLPQFSKILIHLIRKGVGIDNELQKILAQSMRIDLNATSSQTPCKCPSVNGLNGGKIAEENTWVKPVVVIAAIGTVAGIGFWKKDEIMKAVKGKKSVNGLSGTKKKSKKSTSRKDLGNAGMTKIKAIQKRAKKLQHESGYTMKNVKDVEITTTRKSRPKLSWQDALKRAARGMR